MRTGSFTKASEVLDQLDEWLGSLGIEPKRDRWHQAAEMVQRSKEWREVIEQGGSRPPIDNYVDGLFEAMEIHEIMRAFQGNTSAALILLQQRGADWPIVPVALVQVVLVGHCRVIEGGGGDGGVVVGAEGQSEVHTQRMSNLVPDLVLYAKHSIAGIRPHGCNGQTSRASELT